MGFTVYIRREDMRSFDASLARLPDFDSVTADRAAARQPGADSSSPTRLRLGLGLLRGRDKYEALEQRRRTAQIKARHALDRVDLMGQADARSKSRATSVVCGNKDK